MQGDGGLLFGLAATVFIGSLAVLAMRWRELPGLWSAVTGAATSSSAGAAARAAAPASGRERELAVAISTTLWHFGQTIGSLLRS